MEGVDGYVLIHGAHHGSWAFERLLPHLAWPALAVDLPGRHNPAELRAATVASSAPRRCIYPRLRVPRIDRSHRQ